MTAVSPRSLSEFYTKAEFPSSLSLAKSEVEKIPRWDLISRISRLEDTYFTRSDAEAMEARTIKREEDMEARTVKRAAKREEAMIGFTLLTVGIGQIIPILNYFKANGIKLPWE